MADDKEGPETADEFDAKANTGSRPPKREPERAPKDTDDEDEANFPLMRDLKRARRFMGRFSTRGGGR